MILSFHPNIVGHENILCAGRAPNDEDQAAIRRAQAVILPQGCGKALYAMCVKNCSHVFPNYDARFDFPGKLGQARLFQKVGLNFPRTYTFETVSDYHDHYGVHTIRSPFDFPCVFKSDLGGEGEGVFLLKSHKDLERCLHKAAEAEKTGQKGFLFQEYVPCNSRSLRVVVIVEDYYSYWRIQQDPSRFHTTLKAGAVIDHEADVELQNAGVIAVKEFCSKTGLNLAGFDVLFAQKKGEPAPLLLEINYFFGRRGLGGSYEYYKLLEKGVRVWLSRLGLSL